MDAVRSFVLPRHLLIEDLDPNEVFVNKDLYDNNDIEVRYAQALDPWRWTRGWTHAMGMATFLAGIIFIFVLLYIQDLRIDRARLHVAIANAARSPTAEQETVHVHRSFLDRMSTHLRSFTYKRTPSRWWWSGMGNMSLGLALIIMAGFAYPMLYVFTQHPYYLRYARYGPPGLSSRAGMVAISTTPFIIALSMKANIVTVITGVGHERLNALHRWLAGLAGIMAVVHTVPFLVEPYRQGGWAAIGEKLTHGKGNIYYWNGFAALGCLAWLNFASLPFLRRWCYEFFVHLHIFCGVGYIAMLFWHCNNMLSSWHYLWATVIIWVTGLAWRFGFKTNWFSTSGKWFSGDTAVISRLTDDGVKITIATKMRWKPGQHIFLRIPAIGLLDNHPFTIASVMKDDDPLPSPTSDTTHDTTYNDMVLVFKPYAGFTRKAFNISREQTDVSFRALLDGPYGGMPRKLESFDTVLMIAGGSGITPVVAHLQDLCRKIQKGQAVTQDVRIVWTVKRFESLEWFKDEISVACRSVPFGLVHCQYFVTEESPVEFCDYPVSATQQWPKSPVIPDWSTTKPPDAENFASWPQGYDNNTREVAAGLGLTVPDGRSSRGSTREYPLPGTAAVTPKPNFGDEVMIEFGRPRLREGIRPWAETFGRRTCIYVCGPERMKIDVSNAVASLQHDIWRKENVDREEVYLHTETFGW
ncbi:ferric reductase NAD binding domain-containing protein [Peziza echinospora]|nr:ferric reductase NAD binding domain-containing protein [Peziza echinospora]